MQNKGPMHDSNDKPTVEATTEKRNESSKGSIDGNTKNTAKKSVVRKIVELIEAVSLGFFTLVAVLMVIFLFSSKLTGVAPSVAGYQLYTVISGSMSPQIGVGSVVLVRPIDPAKLKEGDIITFRGQTADSILTTHRIIKVNSNENGIDFTTKGDANNVKDPNTVKAERVVGKVYGKIEYLGYFLTFVRSSKGILTMLIIPGGLLIAFELHNIAKLLKRN